MCCLELDGQSSISFPGLKSSCHSAVCGQWAHLDAGSFWSIPDVVSVLGATWVLGSRITDLILPRGHETWGSESHICRANIPLEPACTSAVASRRLPISVCSPCSVLLLLRTH